MWPFLIEKNLSKPGFEPGLSSFADVSKLPPPRSDVTRKVLMQPLQTRFQRKTFPALEVFLKTCFGHASIEFDCHDSSEKYAV